MFGKTLEKFVSYRPFHMFISTVMNTRIDRYEHMERPL